MMPQSATIEHGVLTSNQIEQFLTEGYTVIRNAFPREDAIAWVKDECARAGYDLDDPTTWKNDYVRLPTVRKESVETYAPRAWSAICELMGGADRIAYTPSIGLFAVNLAQGADRPFEPASPKSPGWHVDGWHFRHFLDSPEQGLLAIPLLTDVLPQGGATFVAAGSVGPIARFFASHPEGLLPDEIGEKNLIADCTFIEATGEAGDFYLLHPFAVHAVSQNILRKPRAISNLVCTLKEPMQLARPDGAYSPVEAATLRGLGVEEYHFAPTGERYITPDGGPISARHR